MNSAPTTVSNGENRLSKKSVTNEILCKNYISTGSHKARAAPVQICGKLSVTEKWVIAITFFDFISQLRTLLLALHLK
jgi:hypothetical protein